MATNLAIDPALLEAAYEVGGMRTKKETVTIALEEFIAKRNRGKIVELFGTIDWDDSFDYKAARKQRELDNPS
ncbi:MAG: type II toxin-antitoxin system VapB family antitoxin [Ancrocorticia sp.]|uniref:type II toxin-antitoxin system VapB family antitoxin n=1 Tax=Ancrocorticia sp. TaxID=2593684 RepID=UPI003F93EED1